MAGAGETIDIDEQERRDVETIRRLHLLVRHGYLAQLGGENGVFDAIFLDHVAGGPDLILYPGGTVAAVNKDRIVTEGDEGFIPNLSEANQSTFAEFLRTLRKPTWRERTRSEREKYLYVPGCMLAFLAAAYLVGHVVTQVIRAVFGS